MKRALIVTIDGPAGSGKSTVAAALADRLGVAYLDTGAMYRAVTLAGLNEQIDWADTQALAALAGRCRIEFRVAGGVNRVLLDGRDVTDAIRSPEVTGAAHYIANAAEVRKVLVLRQQAIGLQVGSLVTEGRDQGTVVFPEASYKFYLDADPACRARRRAVQLAEQGKPVNYEDILAAQKQRDAGDTNRKVGPLRASSDAIVLDTTKMPIDDVVDALYNYIDSDQG